MPEEASTLSSPVPGLNSLVELAADILEHKVATHKYPSSNDPGCMKTAGVLSSTPRS